MKTRKGSAWEVASETQRARRRKIRNARGCFMGGVDG
jgi:hypothetical protein